MAYDRIVFQWSCNYGTRSHFFERDLKMRNITIVVIISILAIFFAGGCSTNQKPAPAELKYGDFPPALRKMIDEKIAEVNSGGVICVAGRVKMSDGAHIGSGKDVKVNFQAGSDEQLWIYDDGWFIMGRPVKYNTSYGPGKIVIRAFGYYPIDAAIPILQKDITYAEFILNKTPAEKLAGISGVITNEQDQSIAGAMVNISFPLSYSVVNEQPQRSMNTEPNGHYSFEGLSSTEYHLWIPAFADYAGIAFDVTPQAGEKKIENRKLYKNRSIIIDYVYQADGNRSFTEGNIKKGQVEWSVGPDGMDFSEGRVVGYNYNRMMRDLEMRQDQDRLIFQIFYSNGKNGFYDAGEADFESITEAAESGYTMMPKPCIVGHVYVIHTYEKNYAKFIVRNISENK